MGVKMLTSFNNRGTLFCLYSEMEKTQVQIDNYYPTTSQEKGGI